MPRRGVGLPRTSITDRAEPAAPPLEHSEMMEDSLGPLHASVDRLHDLVRELDEPQLESPSYCDEWSVADVLSHLGSVAVILRRRVAAALDGATLPDDFAQPIWDEWNAKSSRARADDALVEDELLLETVEAVDADERARLAFPTGPVTLSFDEFVALRVNEHALHTWDIEVMFDPTATVPEDAAAVIVDNLGLIARFTARPVGTEREVRIRTQRPERHFTVRLTNETAELLAGDAGVSPDLELPAEAFARLVYGRLDSEHSPPVRANGELLDLLRAVFPGP
jgi:uncharacterized protein (TIGR03083 family)